MHLCKPYSLHEGRGRMPTLSWALLSWCHLLPLLNYQGCPSHPSLACRLEGGWPRNCLGPQWPTLSNPSPTWGPGHNDSSFPSLERGMWPGPGSEGLPGAPRRGQEESKYDKLDTKKPGNP